MKTITNFYFSVRSIFVHVCKLYVLQLVSAILLKCLNINFGHWREVYASLSSFYVYVESLYENKGLMRQHTNALVCK